jgi:hypothetical protein
MNTQQRQSEMRAAAIVCREVAEGAPILYAVKSNPVEPADSGWQFLCGASEEDPGVSQVWALHEVLDYEPTLERFVDKPAGTVLHRSSSNDKWNVEFDQTKI